MSYRNHVPAMFKFVVAASRTFIYVYPVAFPSYATLKPSSPRGFATPRSSAAPHPESSWTA
ncbi:hypothetical protein JAAARDRAFT_53279 [Jaapia argillacea MUCL 33604]|uniref:Uncharacterized protein n=1 Tax=Jaapia argillacea MUCL 33604 TaxID=933084 RepID=A0A067QKA1_9AGAM|nr:hypothetical protein JAAARDRAFT_53279 [Jaapia argillacea MUCL 33604]